MGHMLHAVAVQVRAYPAPATTSQPLVHSCLLMLLRLCPELMGICYANKLLCNDGIIAHRKGSSGGCWLLLGRQAGALAVCTNNSAPRGAPTCAALVHMMCVCV